MFPSLPGCRRYPLESDSRFRGPAQRAGPARAVTGRLQLEVTRTSRAGPGPDGAAGGGEGVGGEGAGWGRVRVGVNYVRKMAWADPVERGLRWMMRR